MSKFIPGLGPKKTVASVTAAFQKAITDLLQIEEQNHAEYDNTEKRISNLLADNQARLAEAEKAAKVRVKLEALLS